MAVVVKGLEGASAPTCCSFGLLNTSMASVENLSLDDLSAETKVAEFFLISFILEDLLLTFFLGIEILKWRPLGARWCQPDKVWGTSLLKFQEGIPMGQTCEIPPVVQVKAQGLHHHGVLVVGSKCMFDLLSLFCPSQCLSAVQGVHQFIGDLAVGEVLVLVIAHGLSRRLKLILLSIWFIIGVELKLHWACSLGLFQVGLEINAVIGAVLIQLFNDLISHQVKETRFGGPWIVRLAELNQVLTLLTT